MSNDLNKGLVAILQVKEALLLDMNSTFMFSEDRFGEGQNYFDYYRAIGGGLPRDVVNSLINRVYDYLYSLYPKKEHRHSFPSLKHAIDAVVPEQLTYSEQAKIIETFSYHEHGQIPDEYAFAIKELSKNFQLSLVVDIWSPKERWLQTFRRMGLWELFAASSFSSDHGLVKPSPKPFEMVVEKLGIDKDKCLVVGDSIRRDLGGACAAGLDCVLVGDAVDTQAVASFSNLLAFQKAVHTVHKSKITSP